MSDGEGTEVQSTTQTESGSEQQGEQLVTPEIQAKFDEVFGGKPASTSDQQPARRAEANATRRQQRKTTPEDETDTDLDTLEVGQSEEVQTETEAEDDLGIVSEKTAKPTPKTPATTKTPTEEASATLPTVLRQAAKRAGWEDDAIDELWETNPEMAERTFKRMHGSLNDLSAQFSTLGRQRMMGGQQQMQPGGMPGRQQQPQQRQQQQALPPADASGDDLLSFVYGDEGVKTLHKEYGQQFVGDVLKPLEEKLIRPFQQMLDFVTQQQQAALASEADGFFKGLEAEWGESYGPNDQRKRTAEQEQARYELALEADAIREGAMAHGIRMSVSEALERAHLLMNRDKIGQMERKSLTKQVQRRSAKITARPTQRNTASSLRPQRSAEAASEAYLARAQELGIELGGDDS